MFPRLAVPGVERFDLTERLACPHNVALKADGGVILFIWREGTLCQTTANDEYGTIAWPSAIYEVHTAFLPGRRGRFAARASLEAYRWMFVRTDCMRLVTMVPAWDRDSESMCLLVGAAKDGERDALWPHDGGLVGCSFWSLPIEEWIKQTPALERTGVEFHRDLDAEFVRHGVVRNEHPPDPWHDRMVGVVLEMLRNGQCLKAIAVYNRWARIAGYMPSKFIAHKPLMIDIGDALLQFSADGQFKALECR